MEKLVMIPAYKPDQRLTELCKKLSENYAVLVVDDGSGKEYDEVFGETSSYATVLRYEKNRGKGGALKYGFSKISELFPECAFIVTADADGQHTPKDIGKVADEVSSSGGLVLGSRAFTGKVPLRSAFGNSVTRFIFRFASGTKIRDTQTGLRAFGKDLLDEFSTLKGDRYEYEMTQLMYAAQKKIPIKEVDIETIYEDNNSSSHFNKFKDSFRIYKVIYSNSTVLKFITSSLVSFGLYYLLVMLLTNFVFTGDTLFEHPAFLKKLITPVDFATGLSWIAGSFLNFMLNKNWVFKLKERFIAALGEYYSLAIITFALKNFVFLKLFYEVLHIPLWLSVPMSELGMYVLNYLIQKKFIFKNKKAE